MSESSEKGVSLEKEIAKILRKKLGATVERDKRSGAGNINKSDLSDWYREIPLFVESKNQKIIKIKDWFRQAEGNASMGQAPTVVFAADNEILACLRFSDLVNFLAEIKDYQAIIADLREVTVEELNKEDGEIVDTLISHHAKTCRNGHLSDAYGYCQQLTCKFSRSYRLPKKKRKWKQYSEKSAQQHSYGWYWFLCRLQSLLCMLTM